MKYEHPALAFIAVTMFAGTALCEPKTLEFPHPISNISFADGGRLMVVYVKESKQLVIVDVEKGERLKEFTLPDENVLFAAGADSLVVYQREKNQLTRIDLKTFARQGVETPAEPIEQLCLGVASRGPVLATSAAKFGDFKQPRFLDLESLKPLDSAELPQAARYLHWRATPDGQTFVGLRSGAELQVLEVQGKQFKATEKERPVNVLTPTPVPCMEHARDYRFSTIYNPLESRLRITKKSYVIPAVHGNYCLMVQIPTIGSDPKVKATAAVHIVGEPLPLLNISDLSLADLREGDWFGSEKQPALRWENRYSLVPSRNRLVEIVDGGKNLRFHQLDLKGALAKAEFNYLFVGSVPPGPIARNKKLHVALDVQSKPAEFKCTLSSGPPGLTISPAGELDWNVPVDFAEPVAKVVISLSNSASKEVFHTFDLKLEALSPSTLPKATSPPARLESLAITPPQLPRDHFPTKLPGPLGLITIGAGGRLILGQCAGQNELVVFDVSQAKIGAQIPLPAGETRYAAGAESAVVYSAANQTLTRFSLKTFEPEQSVPLVGKVSSLVLGHASRGPLVVQWTGQSGPGEAQFFDLATLQPHPRWNPPAGKFRSWWISAAADGRIFALSEGESGQGVTFLELKKDQIRQNYWRVGNGYFQPNADGSAIWATPSGLLFDYRRGPVQYGELTTSGCTALATSGPWFLSSPPSTRDNPVPAQVSLMVADDSRPVATLDMPPPPKGQPARNPFGGRQESWLQFVPEAGILVEVPTAARDHIVLHQCDVASLLAQSAADFLFVASRPQAVVAPGSTFRYQPDVKSKRGSVKVQAAAGPLGIAVSPSGEVKWEVSTDEPEGEVLMTLSIQDASGQSIEHSFLVTVELPRPGSPSRTWTDAATKRTIEARYVETIEDLVELERTSDGKRIRIPLARLSSDDQAHISRIAFPAIKGPPSSATSDPSRPAP